MQIGRHLQEKMRSEKKPVPAVRMRPAESAPQHGRKAVAVRAGAPLPFQNLHYNPAAVLLRPVVPECSRRTADPGRSRDTEISRLFANFQLIFSRFVV